MPDHDFQQYLELLIHRHTVKQRPVEHWIFPAINLVTFVIQTALTCETSCTPSQGGRCKNFQRLTPTDPTKPSTRRKRAARPNQERLPMKINTAQNLALAAVFAGILSGTSARLQAQIGQNGTSCTYAGSFLSRKTRPSFRPSTPARARAIARVRAAATPSTQARTVARARELAQPMALRLRRPSRLCWTLAICRKPPTSSFIFATKWM
jgi:hypothetical protein